MIEKFPNFDKIHIYFGSFPKPRLIPSKTQVRWGLLYLPQRNFMASLFLSIWPVLRKRHKLWSQTPIIIEILPRGIHANSPENNACNQIVVFDFSQLRFTAGKMTGGNLFYYFYSKFMTYSCTSANKKESHGDKINKILQQKPSKSLFFD